MSSEIQAIAQAQGVAVSDDAARSLRAYIDLLQRWNGTYNLTAVRDRPGILAQHIADCLAVVAPLRRQLPTGRLLDVGSGGGLPGVVIAALLPAVEVSCIDTVGKKAAFIRQAAAAMQQPNLHAVHGRVEAVELGVFGVVTSRAFSSLAQFTRLSARHLAPGGVWMAMKGRVPDDEIAELPPEVEVFHVEQLQVPGLDAQRCLVWMRPRLLA